MTNALMTKATTYEVNGETVKLSGDMVKNYLVKGNGNVSDQEVVMFMNLCKHQKLNPFLNDAYLVKFGNQPAQIITSKEAFMKRAESHPQYNSFKAGVVVMRDNELVEIEGAIKLPDDILVGGWAEVYRKDREHPVVSKVSMEEFGKGQSTWKSMPLTMIRKTAIVNAQREAFPEALGAMYTEDDALTETETPKTVQQEVKEEVMQQANTEVIDIDTPEDVEDAEIVESQGELQF